MVSEHIARITGREPVWGATWARDARLMIDRENRTVEGVQRVIAWLGGTSRSGQFWSKNILSPAKLREHFDRLVMEMGDSTPDVSKFEQTRAQAERLRAAGQ